MTPEQAAAVDDSVLTYQPDEAVSAQVRAQFADLAVQSGVVTPENKQQLIDQLAQVTLEQQQEFVDSVFVGEDFKANNLADVVAMNVIFSYYTLLGLESTTTEQDLGVRDFFKVVLSNVPEITGMDNAPNADDDRNPHACSAFLDQRSAASARRAQQATIWRRSRASPRMRYSALGLPPVSLPSDRPASKPNRAR